MLRTIHLRRRCDGPDRRSGPTRRLDPRCRPRRNRCEVLAMGSRRHPGAPRHRATSCRRMGTHRCIHHLRQPNNLTLITDRFAADAAQVQAPAFGSSWQYGRLRHPSRLVSVGVPYQHPTSLQAPTAGNSAGAGVSSDLDPLLRLLLRVALAYQSDVYGCHNGGGLVSLGLRATVGDCRLVTANRLLIRGSSGFGLLKDVIVV